MHTHFNRAFLVVLFGFTTFTSGLYAQQAEIPPAPPESTTEDSAGAATTEDPERIVEGRPALYTPKKALHPFSWIEFGLRPLAQGAEKLTVRFAPSGEKPPKVSGVKFNISGVGGAGSSSGLGPQITPFHNNLFGTGLRVEVPLSVTFKLYESYRFRAFYPLISTEGVDRLGVEFTGRYASRTSEAFYGVGNDSPYWSEARFRSISRTAGVALAAQVNKAWSVRVEEGYRSIGITEPRNYVSVTDAFKDAGIPGLSDPGATMLTTTASLQRNTKDRRYLAGSGGLLNLEASLNEALTGGDFSYWRYRADLEQFIPLDEARRNVIALRATVETTQEKGGSIIPFYDLPTIGGRSSVRGFSSRRYADKSAMSASAEYRYRIWRHMDWGFFVDAGQVAPEIGDFARNRLHTGYGMRFMVRATGDRAVSIDLGHSREGWLFYVDFTPEF